ncbi:MAG: D-alanine--D-alanine ligase [candidate division KSB1 bacterium]|nr:D-alanine--D-alanine ligase [candidate division KSB1 bacterium]
MSTKIHVALLMGGQSAEHEVSLQSAKNVYEALDKSKYEVTIIGIDKNGAWHWLDAGDFLLNADNPKTIALRLTHRHLAIAPHHPTEPFREADSGRSVGRIDVVFPVLHGPLGEDGTIQGLLKILDLPFVGVGVLGSAVGMDKDVMKRLLRDARLPVGDFLVFTRQQSIDFDIVSQRLGLPFFIKPANLGSSVGIHKVRNRGEFEPAINDAFRYDIKVIIEEYIPGREIECSVLGNEDPVASLPGEVVPHHEFYSYEAKYIDDQGADLNIPAELPQDAIAEVQNLAVRAFRTLCCEGMARVDFFLRKDGRLFINEINTIPGFTRISMYPKLWEVSGLSYSRLLDRLIELALERHRRDRALSSQMNF